RRGSADHVLGCSIKMYPIAVSQGTRAVRTCANIVALHLILSRAAEIDEQAGPVAGDYVSCTGSRSPDQVVRREYRHTGAITQGDCADSVSAEEISFDDISAVCVQPDPGRVEAIYHQSFDTRVPGSELQTDNIGSCIRPIYFNEQNGIVAYR